MDAGYLKVSTDTVSVLDINYQFYFIRKLSERRDLCSLEFGRDLSTVFFGSESVALLLLAPAHTVTPAGHILQSSQY